MRSKSLKYFVAAVMLSALVMPVFAKPVVKTVDITGPQKIAGKQLQEGSYTFKIDGTKLTVLNGRKVIAEAEGQWQPRDKKWEHDMYVSGEDGQIQEIRFSGENRSFVIGSH